MKSNTKILQYLVAQGLTSQEMNVYLDKIDKQVKDLFENDKANQARCLRAKQTLMLNLALDIIVAGQKVLLRRIRTAPEKIPFGSLVNATAIMWDKVIKVMGPAGWRPISDSALRRQYQKAIDAASKNVLKLDKAQKALN